MTDILDIIRPDDWHVHLRDGALLGDVARHTARQFGRAIVMPNLRPPITTPEMARAYRQRIMEAVGPEADFEPLMTAYLTDSIDPDAIAAGFEAGDWVAAKLYPANATTNSDAGVTDIQRIEPVLKRMAEIGMPLLIHGEVTEAHVDVFDREAEFIERTLAPLIERHPELRVVLEHITTEQAANFVTENSGRDAQGRLLLAATITPQHLLYNRNALFKGGLQPHWYCLPVLKREVHRKALLKAATSGLPQFFLGTDSAPHARHLKEMSCGCAGCYSAPYAMAMYAEAFEQMEALESVELFEKFCSLNGPAFYGLPVNEGVFELQRKSFEVPQRLPFVTESGIVPLRAGEVLDWTVTRLR